MATITWTHQAEFWLKEIFDYIAQDNPTAAANVISGLYEKAQLLKHNPQLGYQYNHESDLDIRILLYGHYRITYLSKNNTEIEILGVFHGALDIEKYLVP